MREIRKCRCLFGITVGKYRQYFLGTMRKCGGSNMTNRVKIMLLCWILFCTAAIYLDRQNPENQAWKSEDETQQAAAGGTRAEPEDAGEAQTRQTSADPGQLYALSAVLMDGETGRVLYEKEGDVKRPMASTTKVMTCILALEHSRGDEVVEVSSRAAAQPDVQLNIIEGEQFYMEDLLYSLMLKSHNDTAVAIAEHIGGSVEGFAKMMNDKAIELGCTDTHFVTPNGLDEEDEGGIHSTTARDLARIMRYAIQNETFLKITQTREYSFWDLEHTRQFQVTNANAFLDMMDGVISGKTGFTADAGYCYVCALEREDRVFIVTLLGCGWPNHKTYKWSDSRTLLEYGLENYENRKIWQEPELEPVPVRDGVPPEGKLNGETEVSLICRHEQADEEQQLLLGAGEAVEVHYDLPRELKAPVKEGEVVGTVEYSLNGTILCQYPVETASTVEELDFLWCVEQVFHRFFQEK